MYKIAVMGGRDTVIGFRALGLDVFPVSGEDEVRHVFHRLTRQSEDYAIIYVEEGLNEYLAPDIEKFKDCVTPSIILIPGKDGSKGIGLSALQAAVERAVGADIL